MKLSPFIFLIALIGCSQLQKPNPTSQMNYQIQQWIPKGTTIVEARLIMEQHHFVCTIGSYDSKAAMPSGSDPLWWDTGSFISKTGQTLPVTNVTILTCKRADTTNEVWAYDATLTAVDGECDGRYLVSARRVR